MKQVKKLLFTFFAMSNYDIFHFHFGTSLFGLKILPHLDLPILKKMNKQIYVHYRGSDLLSENYYKSILSLNHENKNLNFSSRKQLKNYNIFKKYSDNIFVSTPNLLEVAKQSTIIPQIIDLVYDTENNILKKRKKEIHILHAPTDRRKKGTNIIIDAIQKLKNDGYNIKLEIIENIKSSDVLEYYKKCDFCIDQLLLGWYGKVTLELLSLQKPVFVNINKKYLKYFDDIPVVNVKPENLYEKLKYHLDNPNELKDLSLKGPDYVRKYHSPEKVVEKLLNVYAKK